MPKALPKEKASFTIVNPNNMAAISFAVNGSTVAAIDEAFSWLPVGRRVKVLERLNKTHAALLEKEAARASDPIPLDAN